MPNVQTPTYSGPERRRRRVYITRNHEYHCLDGICIAVREIGTGALVRGHAAIGKRVTAGVRVGEDGIETISPPDQAQPGERIHFVAGADDPHYLVTSPLKEMIRPRADGIAYYDARR